VVSDAIRSSRGAEGTAFRAVDVRHAFEGFGSGEGEACTTSVLQQRLVFLLRRLDTHKGFHSLGCFGGNAAVCLCLSRDASSSTPPKFRRSTMSRAMFLDIKCAESGGRRQVKKKRKSR